MRAMVIYIPKMKGTKSAKSDFDNGSQDFFQLFAQGGRGKIRQCGLLGGGGGAYVDSVNPLPEFFCILKPLLMQFG